MAARETNGTLREMGVSPMVLGYMRDQQDFVFLDSAGEVTTCIDL